MVQDGKVRYGKMERWAGARWKNKMVQDGKLKGARWKDKMMLDRKVRWVQDWKERWCKLATFSKISVMNYK